MSYPVARRQAMGTVRVTVSSQFSLQPHVFFSLSCTAPPSRENLHFRAKHYVYSISYRDWLSLPCSVPTAHHSGPGRGGLLRRQDIMIMTDDIGHISPTHEATGRVKPKAHRQGRAKGPTIDMITDNTKHNSSKMLVDKSLLFAILAGVVAGQTVSCDGVDCGSALSLPAPETSTQPNSLPAAPTETSSSVGETATITDAITTSGIETLSTATDPTATTETETATPETTTAATQDTLTTLTTPPPGLSSMLTLTDVPTPTTTSEEIITTDITGVSSEPTPTTLLTTVATTATDIPITTDVATSSPEPSIPSPSSSPSPVPAPPGGGKCETCSPNPFFNKCTITTSCIGSSGSVRDRFYCACRAGYRASGGLAPTDPRQFRLAFLGQEHRVFVAPGVECDELCTTPFPGQESCQEVPVRADC
ncbi:hypothetical protein B0T26DRAFT_874020 [Lasiosphaeria miniovina]|uniref:Uncharacterized protein n=1 Tax=Lasiosphaeria miniovina TaxID=1954250 RepID=A0AA40ADS2_9PEZI|nr:uncharacterized protein B0T26DRAFT_874020 [Lasiosphaeria miniovina]KAK0714044.1 hypothetical protein B0T26DRAFT_874020 [Lasiosphaeria miniovina]